MGKQWEYKTGFLYADINSKEAREYFAESYPEWNKPPRFTPQSMEVTMNEMGKMGWELVHFESVPRVGENADFGHPSGSGTFPIIWSNAYFYVFKREVEKDA